MPTLGTEEIPPEDCVGVDAVQHGNVEWYADCDFSKALTQGIVKTERIVEDVSVKEEPRDDADEAVSGDFVLKTEEVDLGCDYIEYSPDSPPLIEDGLDKQSRNTRRDRPNSKPALRRAKSKKIKPHTCDFCGKSYTVWRSLNRHVWQTCKRLITLEETESIKCPMCPDMYHKKTLFQQHLMTHIGDKSYSCNVCNKSFYSAARLESHMIKHSEENLNKCLVCTKKFGLKADLVKHMATHRSGQPHKCDSCDRTFATRAHLIVHMRTHSNEKPNKCALCDKQFTRAWYLNRHWNDVHIRSRLAKKGKKVSGGGGEKSIC